MDPLTADLFRACLASRDPIVKRSGGSSRGAHADRFHARTQICLAIHPQIGPPRLLGLHHSADTHSTRTGIWAQDAQRFLKIVGAMTVDALGNQMLTRALETADAKVDAERSINRIDDPHKSASLHHALFEAMPSGVAVLDAVNDGATFKILDMNRAAEMTVGLLKQDLIGQTLDALFPGFSARRGASILRQTWNTAQPATYALVEHRRRRILKWIEFRVQKLPSAQIVAIFTDMTEQKNAELEARRAHASRKTASTTDGHQDDPQSDFLAQFAHELRTPLTAIVGFAELISKEVKGKLPDDYKEYAENINTSSKHLLQIINQLLDLSKIDAGKMSIFPEVFKVKDIVDDTCRVLLPIAENNGVELRNALPDQDIMTADPVRFRQILFNTIGNAIKYAPNTSVSIECHADANRYQLQVVDCGRGMSPDEVRLALQPFGMVGNHARTHCLSGTGLGLSVTKKLMELHGGQVRLNSRKGQGTTVTLDFPSELVKKASPSASIPSAPCSRNQ